MRTGRPLARWAGIAASIAIVSGVSLAFAPVEMSRVDVTWPQDPAAVESTALLLVNQTPHTIDVAFDENAIEQAANGGGIVFATIDPIDTEARSLGTVVETSGGSVIITQRGRSVTLGQSAGRWHLSSSVAGTTVSLDGQEVASWPDVLPPQIDALMSDVTATGPDGLKVSIQVVDDANTSPSWAKVTIMAILWLAVLTALALLSLDDRSGAARSASRPAARASARIRAFLSPIDALVIASLAGWILIGPMTDDDGYYATMALNYSSAGYVGNYFQMFDQSFTPFSWFWQFLSAWQELGGRSPVWLRVPSLLAGIVTWYLARRFLDASLRDRSRGVALAGRALLVLGFLAWWFAYPIGSRPESLGALGGMVALTGVTAAIERRRLLPVAVGALAAGLAFAAHPTGAVAFAPLLVALPSIWAVARRESSTARAVGRTLAVLSVGSIALFAAFADGTLHDVLTGRALFASVETPLGLTNENLRYSLLLSDAPMGSYAKRVVVLLSLTLLVWFLVLALAARLKDRAAIPTRLALVGWTLPMSLLALFITPSKWTHHFGAIAGVGPLFIVLVALGIPYVIGVLARGSRVPGWLAPAALVTIVPAAVLTFRGPNQWAYAWDQGMPSPGAPPLVGGYPLASAPIWAAVVAVVAIATLVGLRLARRSWRDAAGLFGVPTIIAVALTMSTTYLAGSFISTTRPAEGFSVAAATIADPVGRKCLTAEAVTVWDARRGSPLTAADLASPTPAEDDLPKGAPFTPAGWPEEASPPAAVHGWASHASGDTAVGVFASPWFEVPEVSAGQRLGLLAGGLTTGADGTRLTLEFAAEDGRPLGTADLADTAVRPGWSTLVVSPDALPTATDLVRIVAVDGSTQPSGWLGFSEPVLIRGVTLGELSADDATAIGWTMTFWFPCQRPMELANGIIEPPVLATTWGPGSPDNIWLVQRGGSLAGVTRLADVTTAASEMTGAGTWWGRVALFEYSIALDAYDLRTHRVTTWGFSSPFGELPQLVEYDRRSGDG